ncbi:MAG: HNH endonuclease [Planctomycetota bacterium]|jgi:5-methylcytosine-specific restriction endonuclease McrA
MNGIYAARLDEPTLVLNRSWLAISTTTVRKALSLLYQRAASAICPNTYQAHDFASWTALSVARDEPCIRTVTLRLRVPEIIVLRSYDSLPRRTVAFSRRNLYRRDGYTCMYCGSRPGSEELTIDHILPRSQGGRTTWQNCALACVECNKRKANRNLHQAGMRLRKAPKVPRWSWDVEIAIGRRRASWESFLSERYWNIELID